VAFIAAIFLPPQRKISSNSENNITDHLRKEFELIFKDCDLKACEKWDGSDFAKTHDVLQKICCVDKLEDEELQEWRNEVTEETLAEVSKEFVSYFNIFNIVLVLIHCF